MDARARILPPSGECPDNDHVLQTPAAEVLLVAGWEAAGWRETNPSCRRSDFAAAAETLKHADNLSRALYYYDLETTWKSFLGGGGPVTKETRERVIRSRSRVPGFPRCALSLSESERFLFLFFCHNFFPYDIISNSYTYTRRYASVCGRRSPRT